MTFINNKSNTSNRIELFFFLTIWLIIAMAAGLILSAFTKMLDISDVQAFLGQISETSPIEDRYTVKGILSFNQIFTFIIPSFVFVFLIHKKRAFSFLQLNRLPPYQLFVIGTLLVILAFPIAQLLLKLNQMVILPDLAADAENQVNNMTAALLVMETPWEFLTTLGLIAVLPALGEELIFRGIVQNYLVKEINPHVAIWVSAAIFSALHLQFAGFLPRLFLGGLLGYLFYWSGSLWLAIFAHFINNGVQVMAVYFYKKQGNVIDTEAAVGLPWFAYLVSILLFISIVYWFLKNTLKTEQLNTYNRN
ncbi:MAG: lysostaphin resistance A-like protein [Saprospiraceae bacterium]